MKEGAMTVTTSSSPTAVIATEGPASDYIEWGPLILGAIGATAISVVLLTFGAALGLSVVSPYPFAGISAKGLAVLTGTYTALALVASFAAGGYLAGRLRAPWVAADAVERHFRDGAHGFGVWALGVLLGAALAVSGAGAILKTAVYTSGAVAAAGTAGAASSQAAGAALSTTPTDYAVDRLLAAAPGAAGAVPAPGAAGAVPVAAAQRSDLAAPIARAFAANLHNPQLDTRDRATLAQLVVQRTGMAQADAEKRVDDAFTELKAAEQKARDAAEHARKATLIAAFVAAATLAIGCAAACAGAEVGARHRDQRTLVVLFGSRRFW
jgi:hypothetical protein